MEDSTKLQLTQDKDLESETWSEVSVPETPLSERPLVRGKSPTPAPHSRDGGPSTQLAPPPSGEKSLPQVSKSVRSSSGGRCAKLTAGFRKLRASFQRWVLTTFGNSSLERPRLGAPSSGVSPSQQEWFEALYDSNLKDCQEAVDGITLGAELHTTVIKRIITEIKALKNYNPRDVNFSIAPLGGGNIFNWLGIIFGPSDTPYEGGVFYLRIQLPPDYPFKPPRISFVTKVYHPNVASNGVIRAHEPCNGWTPALTMPLILLTISSVLAEPQIGEHAVSEIALLYRDNRELYNATAKWHTNTYATGGRPEEHELLKSIPSIAHENFHDHGLLKEGWV